MRDFRNLVYSVLDELKILGDDTVWENEHVISIILKYRALLFNQKYKGKKIEIPPAWYQRLSVKFDVNYRRGDYYKSLKEIPTLIDTANIWQYTFVHADGIHTYDFNFINPQRFKNVGKSKWLKNEVYITIDLNRYMYVKSPLEDITKNQFIANENNSNPSLFISEDGLNLLLQELLSDGYVMYDTILDNPIEGYRFNDDNRLDVLDFEFPCEESLIQPILELSIKELGMMNQLPRDTQNNATDESGLATQRQQQ